MPSTSNSKTKTPVPPHLQPGANVEVYPDEEGLRGSWFTATVVRRASAKQPNKYLIEYHKLYADESGKKQLREIVDAMQIRPEVPREKERKFKFSEHVDALFNDGWWEGVITEERQNGKFAVFFRMSKELIDFEAKDLRLHREWVDGEWKPPLERVSEKFEQPLDTPEINSDKSISQKKVVPAASPTSETKVRESKKRRKAGAMKSPCNSDANSESVQGKFSSGMPVEVSSDEDGLKGAWFAATIVEAVGKDKYLVEYESLRTEDDTGFLREEIDILHIRPRPPETIVVDSFKLMDEVDALYNDAWWLGLIHKVRANSMYLVYFKDTNEELVFDHSDLRPHQDWIDGKWITASEVLA